METIIENGLNKLSADKVEIVVNEKPNSKPFSAFYSIKKNNIEDVCAKLKNDLKWYWDDVVNYNFKQNEKNSQENILVKEVSEKTASKLVEEWWLSS